jgi:PAS domain S-box-containing protein
MSGETERYSPREPAVAQREAMRLRPEPNEALETLVDNASAPILVLDPQFRIIRFNHAFESLTGRTSKDMAGESPEMLFPPNLVRNSVELIKKTVGGQRLDGVEIDLQHLDGSVRTVLWNSATLFGPDGKTPLATIAQGQDITERIAAEKLLRRSEATYRALYQDSADGILITDVETRRLRYANPAACRLLGYSEAELRTLALEDLHPKDDVPRVLAEVEAQFRGDKALAADLPFLRKDGATLYADVSGVNIVVDGRVSVAGFFRDITRRKRAEEMLAQKTMLLEAHLQTSIQGILAVDSAGHAILINRRFGELWNLPPHLLEGKDDAKMLECASKQVKDPAEFARKVAYLYEHKDETCRDEVEFADGRCLDRYSSPLVNGEGTYCGRIWYHSDITERKRAEEKLRLTSADLERSNKELEQFAYAASHDLQEPLRMVSSYTQLLARRYKGQLDADAQEFIAFAVDGANRMQRLINDLLAYSRVGTRGKPSEPVDCAAALDQALVNLEAAIAGSGAVVTHDPLPTVTANRSQIVQLFQNLIGNALKFHLAEPPRVHLSAVQQGNEWLFRIRDDGIGIDPQYAGRIFNLFERLHTREEYPGTGIGLAICKKIVERHAGRIWVESQLAKGSTFCFTIPLGGNGL